MNSTPRQAIVIPLSDKARKKIGQQQGTAASSASAASPSVPAKKPVTMQMAANAIRKDNLAMFRITRVITFPLVGLVIATTINAMNPGFWIMVPAYGWLIGSIILYMFAGREIKRLTKEGR